MPEFYMIFARKINMMFVRKIFFSILFFFFGGGGGQNNAALPPAPATYAYTCRDFHSSRALSRYLPSPYRVV